MVYGEKMEKIRFQIREKELTLYPAQGEDRPLIVFNTVMGDGEELWQALRALDAPDCNLLVVGKLQWYHDMTPWRCQPLSKRGPAATGGADAYLETLASEIVPAAREKIRGSALYVGIAGYSLAGRFALYAMYRCDCFAWVASMSGSLWFPKFREYVLRHELMRQPEMLYMSLGDAEAKTKHAVLKTVQENTEAIVRHYQEVGVDVRWELNPGNHFRDVAMRRAKGIKAILEA